MEPTLRARRLCDLSVHLHQSPGHAAVSKVAAAARHAPPAHSPHLVPAQHLLTKSTRSIERTLALPYDADTEASTLSYDKIFMHVFLPRGVPGGGGRGHDGRGLMGLAHQLGPWGNGEGGAGQGEDGADGDSDGSDGSDGSCSNSDDEAEGKDDSSKGSADGRRNSPRIGRWGHHRGGADGSDAEALFAAAFGSGGHSNSGRGGRRNYSGRGGRGVHFEDGKGGRRGTGGGSDEDGSDWTDDSDDGGDDGSRRVRRIRRRDKLEKIDVDSESYWKLLKNLF